MRDLPSGTVTFLFTDVEGSTQRWEQDSPAMLAAIERHFALLDDAIIANNGRRFKVIGDAVQAAFPTALDALLATVAAQRALLAEDWGALGPITVRMALHTGAATPRDGDYLAPVLNRLARLLAVTTGGQMVLTEVTRNLVHELLPDGIHLRDLGEHRLRDLREAERVFQIDAEGLPDAFPPLKTVDRQMHNLPVQLTEFVGREREVEEAKRQLAEPGRRLLTLTGPGGTGKTRLALRVATDLIEGFPDGVWFVALAPVTTHERVAPAIAEAVGVRESPAEPIAETLRAFLRAKHLLLVLDNFEHVVAAAPLVADLLAASPGLQILATSRTPFRISGERELPIQPMGLPEDVAAIQVDDALASEAVRLFVDRARTVRGDFALTERNVATVAAICRRLDGLPLAIELAAARVRLLSPEAILARLDNRLGLLTGGGRDRPERQQTLRAAIAWSHDLLEPAEQALFRRLAVFVGGWSLEAAEALGDAIPDPAVDVLDGIAALNDNSLIRRADISVGHDDGAGPRFFMLQTIQEFAREQLAMSGEQEPLQDAHAAHFAALAVGAEPHLFGPAAVEWLDRLEADHDNLRAALDWRRERTDGARAVQIAAAMWRFWWLRGYITEGRAQLDVVLALPASQNGTKDRATALDGAGVLAETQGDYGRAETLHQEALALSRNTNDAAAIARSIGNLGVVAFDRGEGDRASSLLEESLALARNVGDEPMVAIALNDLGAVAFARHDLEQAASLFQESLELRRRIGSGSEIARTLNNLGGVALEMRDFGRACELFEESLRLYRAAGDTWGTAGALTGLGTALLSTGVAAEAPALFEEALALFQETGDIRSSGVTLLTLADAARDRGELDQSAALYREAMSGFQEIGAHAGVADCLAGLGGILASGGRFEPAAQLLGAAIAQLPDEEADGFTQSERYQADAEAIRAALGESAFTAALKTGRAMPVEAALAMTVPAASLHH